MGMTSGLREQLNRKPIPTSVAVVVICGVVVTLAVMSQCDRTQRFANDSSVFLTADDGAHFSEGRLERLRDSGSSEVRAHVFRCGQGHEFVGYLSRLTPQLLAGGSGLLPPETLAKPMPGMMEVKRPGDSNWVRGASPESTAILQVKCPQDGSSEVEEVEP